MDTYIIRVDRHIIIDTSSDNRRHDTVAVTVFELKCYIVIALYLN